MKVEGFTTVVIGDWSGDGHMRVRDYVLKVTGEAPDDLVSSVEQADDLPSAYIYALLDQAKDKFGIDCRNLCTTSNGLTDDEKAALTAAGIGYPDYMVTDYLLYIFMDVIKLMDPKLELTRLTAPEVILGGYQLLAD